MGLIFHVQAISYKRKRRMLNWLWDIEKCEIGCRYTGPCPTTKKLMSHSKEKIFQCPVANFRKIVVSHSKNSPKKLL